MSPLEARCLEAFPRWLEGMAGDALALAAALEQPDTPEPLRQASAEALSHLLVTLPLIPKGVESLGYLQVLFAWRAIAERAARLDAGLVAGEAAGVWGRFAAEAEQAGEFLGADARRWRQGAERGAYAGSGARSARALLTDEEARARALEELRSWAAGHAVPAFGEGPEELVKLGSFMRTRLLRLVPDEAQSAEHPAP